MEKQALFSHILVAVDGSDTSVQAGRMAIQLATAHEARITFVYVVDSTASGRIAGATSRAPESVSRDLEDKAERYLDYLSRLAHEAGLPANREVRHGVPASEIERSARQQGADLIVIGKTGCRGPHCVLVGSVAERVIERAVCPVLIVSSPPSQRA